MPGPEFFQTRMGVRFYEVTAPRVAEELGRLNDNLEALVAILRDRDGAAPPTPTAAPAGGTAADESDGARRT